MCCDLDYAQSISKNIFPASSLVDDDARQPQIEFILLKLDPIAHFWSVDVLDTTRVYPGKAISFKTCKHVITIKNVAKLLQYKKLMSYFKNNYKNR